MKDLSKIVLIVGAVLWLTALALLGQQCLWWLADGVWMPYPIAVWLADQGIVIPPTEFLGLNKIIRWLLDVWAGVYLILGGLIAAFFSFGIYQMSIEEEARKRAKAAIQPKRPQSS